MGQLSEDVSVLLKEDAELRGWDAAAAQDPGAAAADLAHAIRFGRAQEALEQVMAGSAGLTAEHARAIHFANEMAELRHYGPLIAVDDGVPVLAPGVLPMIACSTNSACGPGNPPGGSEPDLGRPVIGRVMNMESVRASRTLFGS